ncbi:hypothetical protein J3R30DRAFT_3289983 [Lentinula aciculospora]|uniref:Cyclin N-terminal domain-containing protein n=1 Tax=Lentinula aciculospora TaxID=153920 RepID=A0A9W9ACX5_9AGAR|nr:hypothetical protein J3R30DRAFT_3289983 [Lentinula aciculospora]
MHSSVSSPGSSPSSSAKSSPVHHASLVDPSMHSPVLLQLVDVKLSQQLIDYVVDCVADTVDFAMGRPSHPRGRVISRRPELIKFTTFVTTVLTRAEVTTPVVLASLAYIDRAKPHLHIALEEWALERVFLGALIVASKYLNDSTLKNVHWALCTGVFGKRDVGRIEREFLDVLDWELSISEDDVLSHHVGISAAIAPSPSRNHHHHHHSSPHHHHEYPRNHPRSHHRTSCPDLEPSSPISSDGSSSPQTPSTLNNSPESFPPTKGSLVSAHSDSGLGDILRSFPIPSHHTQTHFPIQV